MSVYVHVHIYVCSGYEVGGSCMHVDVHVCCNCTCMYTCVGYEQRVNIQCTCMCLVRAHLYMYTMHITTTHVYTTLIPYMYIVYVRVHNTPHIHVYMYTMFILAIYRTLTLYHVLIMQDIISRIELKQAQSSLNCAYSVHIS